MGTRHTHTQVMRDMESGASRGFGFVNYDNFESSDLAIECMNGQVCYAPIRSDILILFHLLYMVLMFIIACPQFLSNRALVVQYAINKNSPGERHGSAAGKAVSCNNIPWHGIALT